MGDSSFGDYWSKEQLTLNILTKEMLALVKALKAAPHKIRDCRVDVNVNSQVVIDTAGSLQLTAATKDLHITLVERNL